MRLGTDKLPIHFVFKSPSVLDTTVRHPVFPEEEIKIVPSRHAKTGTGSGFKPICPAHDLESLETSDEFRLPNDGHVSPDGTLDCDGLEGLQIGD